MTTERLMEAAFTKVATPGRYSFPVWASWVLETSPLGHRTLAMRTDQRSQPFSEFLLFDLETFEYRGVLFEELPEVWWGCLHQHPSTGVYYAVRPNGIYRLDWASGMSEQLVTDPFPDGHLPREGAWDADGVLWVTTYAPQPGLFRIELGDRPYLTCVAQAVPPSKHIGYAYIPLELQVTPSGNIWLQYKPGCLLAFWERERQELSCKLNFSPAAVRVHEQAGRRVSFTPDLVLAYDETYDFDSGQRLDEQPTIPDVYRGERWLDKVTGWDGMLFDVDWASGKQTEWGRRPPAHLFPPPSHDDRWTPSIQWAAVHGRRAFGVSHQLEPQVAVLIYDADSQDMVVHDIPWRPQRAQRFYSLHLGPDGNLYGSNYSQTLWRVKPKRRATESLGWAVPARPGGEIWCFANVGQKLFLASYTESWLSVYDPKRPWQPGIAPGDNPRNLLRLIDYAPDQTRPRGLALAHNGLVYMASCADYGEADEGALAAIDPVRESLVDVHYPAVPGQQLFSLLASPDRDELYLGTYQGSWWTSADCGKFVVYDTQGRCAEHVYDMSDTVVFLAVAGGVVAGVVRREWGIFFYDSRRGVLEPPVQLAKRKTFHVAARPSRDSFMVLQEGQVYDLNPSTRELRLISSEDHPVPGGDLFEGPDGDIYYRDHNGLDIGRFTPSDR